MPGGSISAICQWGRPERSTPYPNVVLRPCHDCRDVALAPDDGKEGSKVPGAGAGGVSEDDGSGGRGDGAKEDVRSTHPGLIRYPCRDHADHNGGNVRGCRQEL